LESQRSRFPASCRERRENPLQPASPVARPTRIPGVRKPPAGMLDPFGAVRNRLAVAPPPGIQRRPEGWGRGLPIRVRSQHLWYRFGQGREGRQAALREERALDFACRLVVQYACFTWGNLCRVEQSRRLDHPAGCAPGAPRRRGMLPRPRLSPARHSGVRVSGYIGTGVHAPTRSRRRPCPPWKMGDAGGTTEWTVCGIDDGTQHWRCAHSVTSSASSGDRAPPRVRGDVC